MFRCLTIAPAVILLSLTGCRSTTDDRLDRISARLDELDKKITALDAGVSGKSDSALFAANINQPNPMSGPCYDKLSKVKEPPPNPTREQARAYVREIMAVSAGQNSFSSMDPQVRMLYGIGPENWDLLLPYTETNHYAKTVLAELTPLSAKDKVLAQLRRHPALITVVLRNGWVGDAGDSIFELIENSGDRYPPECAPAIPFLAETAEGRKRLTECFTNNPRCFFIYDTLRLRKDINVKDTVETAWENFKGSRLNI
jgi:hypothetical protein